jgi:hypothetical protein
MEKDWCIVCKLLNPKARRTIAARKWAKKMGIDLKTWPGGLKDFAQALAR